MASSLPDNAGADTVLSVFDEAHKAFRAQLSSEELAEISSVSSIEELLQAVRALSENHFLHKSRYKTCARKITQFGQSFAPYFEVINIFVQTNPEYAGLVWGSIRLILKLGGHYVTFLEKLGSFFDQMREQLPAYTDAIEILRQDQNRDGKRFDRRLLVSLSWIYKDVIQFCYEAYKLLSNKIPLGFRSKQRLIWRISWEPFDDRFGSLLKRLQWHSQLFEKELVITQLELNMTQLDSIRKQQEDLRLLYDEFEKEVITSQQLKEKQERNWERDEINLKHRCIARLKDWLNAPDWEDAHDSALSRVKEGSTDWFFSDTKYRNWWSTVTNSWKAKEKANNMTLIIQAKPGYGKTHLCSSLVDQLRSESLDFSSDAMDSHNRSAVCFYYFDTTKPWTVSAQCAFQALLTQLVHLYMDDKEAIDAACMMMYHGLSGQRNASKNEVLALLNWLLRRYPMIVLVIDGLDETNDVEMFLTDLRIALTGHTHRSRQKINHAVSSSDQTQSEYPPSSDTAIVMFARPDVPLPQSLLQSSDLLLLHNEQNLEAINDYLYDALEYLVDNGLLGNEHNIHHLAQKAALYSDGMFLWARLLDNYLRTDGLTVQERLDALNNLVYLKGLKNLYDAILSRLNGAYQISQAVTLPEQASKLTSPLGRIIPNFRDAIRKMTGALLEVATDDSVVFIHNSLGDYLHLRRLDSDIDTTNLDASEARIDLATSCMSYLTNCLPGEPLSGSSSVTPDLRYQTKRFPFLNYVIEYWTAHVASALRTGIFKEKHAKFAKENNRIRDSTRLLLSMVRRFIEDKKQ
ncbi:hypothetical protein BDV96DRAFT_654121 [Lophiotrema nucula]|uniref:NACHT domain-containing protein n=1 Tax=Lophiotrema nucula TaxID=690887 RepID=A0A6A5YIF9_9PLEO|nr:hypothetical protein BDV96DRAFT_654121 [Lophiotrema nucula]